MRVADYIVNFLVERNVNDIFVLTGFGAMYLNDAIASRKKLKYYCVRNEAASPMMAEAYARVKGSIGAVCLTAGPGSTNAVPGLVEAWVDSAPVIIISGQVEKKYTSHNLRTKVRSFGTAEVNIVPVVQSLTKFAVMINDPNSIRFNLEKAFYLATSGRPGPVWLDIPQDIQYAKVEPKKLKGFNPPKKNDDNKGSHDAAKKVLELLNNSERPLIIAGNGIRQGGAVSGFKKLVKKLGIPIILTRLGLDLLPYSDAQNMGLGGIKGTRFCSQIMRSCDLVLVLGARLAIPFVGPNLDAFNKKAKIVVVDIEDSELKKPGVRIDFPINDDALGFIDKLNDLLVRYYTSRFHTWLSFCQKLKRENPILTKEMIKNPIDLYYFMSRLDALSGAKHILITDAGSNYYVGGQVFTFEKRQREVTSAAFAAMGLGVPLAIGAAIAKKNAQILAVTGDGSLELNIQELKTMSYYNLNIKLFVINNGGYVSMRNWQDEFFEGRRIGSDKTTGMPVLNLKRIASAFDLKYESIQKFEQIDEKLMRIMNKSGPLFVEVFCDNQQRIIEPIR